MTDPRECVRCGEALDDHPESGECPTEESDEPTTEEVRAEAADALGSAHVAVYAVVEFPREENDLDDLDVSSGRFMATEELSNTEKLAGHTVIEEAVDGMADSLDRMTGGPDTGGMKAMMATPAQLQQVLGSAGGGSDGDGDDGPDMGGFA